ncbi:MAG: hypothetical protein K2F57_05200, partial [Candidatus Gastranaerophilales bacterium]|nr:hypothetical protein [Candidatus Gastranaerophilales bacterium]
HMDMLTNKIASEHLGKKSKGSETYDSSLLVAVPRFENRQQYGIENENLPFNGFDVWHAYEFSVLTLTGLPVTRVMKLKYSCESEFIIESKSLKLYLNSFNMTRIGNGIIDCLNQCKQMIEKDLSILLKADVEVSFLDDNIERVEIFQKYQDIMNFIDDKTLYIDKFKESPELLKYEQTEDCKSYYLKFDSLRSNCRVTHQPDFGEAFIYYNSSKHIEETSLVKYLSSFRSEYHFHEECCEMIYKRLLDLLGDECELFVCALYTRRGGIDICPARWSKGCLVEDIALLENTALYAKSGIKSC